jgi:hypothetical protein
LSSNSFSRSSRWMKINYHSLYKILELNIFKSRKMKKPNFEVVCDKIMEIWTYDLTIIIAMHCQLNTFQLPMKKLILYNYWYKNEFLKDAKMIKWNLIIQNSIHFVLELRNLVCATLNLSNRWTQQLDGLYPLWYFFWTWHCQHAQCISLSMLSESNMCNLVNIF